MKKLLLIPFITLLFISCEGPMGPPGRDGLDGINILGQIFEAQINFSAGDNYEAFVDIPNQIEVFDTDIIMAYILVGEFEGRDIWEPLPQTLFFEDETLLYGFNYTTLDVGFFLDGTVDFDNLPSEFTQNIIFRVAVLPADAVQGMDLSNMENVLNSLINKEIIKIN